MIARTMESDHGRKIVIERHHQQPVSAIEHYYDQCCPEQGCDYVVQFRM